MSWKKMCSDYLVSTWQTRNALGGALRLVDDLQEMVENGYPKPMGKKAQDEMLNIVFDLNAEPLYGMLLVWGVFMNPNCMHLQGQRHATRGEPPAGGSPRSTN